MPGMYLVDEFGNVLQSLPVAVSGSYEEKAGAPVLIATIPFSSFAASSTFTLRCASALKPNAKRRSFTIVNNLNQGGTNMRLALYDLAAKNAALPAMNDAWFQALGDTVTIATLNALGYNSFSGAGFPALNAPADSFAFILTIGATAPTSGNLYILVREVVENGAVGV